MLLWIPVNSDNKETATITAVADATKWALVKFEDAKVAEVEFFDSIDAYDDWVDCLVIKDKYESTIEYMDAGLMVLCTRSEETIDEITEAFVFRELDEVGL